MLLLITKILTKLALILCLSLNAEAQLSTPGLIATTNNSAVGQDTTYEWFETLSPTNNYGNRETLLRARKKRYLRFYFDTVFISALGSGRNDGVPTGVTWVTSDGRLNSSPMSELVSGLSSNFASVSSLSNYWLKTDTIPGSLMTTSAAMSAIGDINSSISGKVPNARTITINGVSQNLSADRSWSLSTSNISEGSNLYYTDSRARTSISLTTIGSGGVATYNSGTGVLNIPNYSPSSPTINNNVSRSLSNSAGSTNQYTISTTQYSRVNYSITINWTITAILNSSGTVFLEYSIDNGSNWITVSQVTCAYNLGLTLSGSNDMNLSGEIPPSAQQKVRLRTTTTNATCTYTRGQETLY